MVVRAWVAVVAVLPSCALISGLGTLNVSDGGGDADANVDVLVSDASIPNDATRAGNALQFSGSCAVASSASSFNGSNLDFAVAFWLRVDSTSTASVESPVIVWHGGRDTTEPGWSITMSSANLSFCVSDASSAKCTAPGYAIQQGHLVHIVAETTYDSTKTGSRILTLYARDVTAGETTHTQAGSFTGAPNTWASTSLFSIAGASSGNACTNTTSITIDDLRIVNGTVPTPSAMDSLESANIPCNTPTLVADFRFDEGTGMTTADCTSSDVSLTFGDKAGWIPSPFP